MSSTTFAHSRIRVAMVTNIPTPYRIPVYERVAMEGDIDLQVIFFSGREPDREWDLGDGSFRKSFLKENFFKTRDRFIHLNPDVWPSLRSFAPDVVITTGFNPTHLLAYAYARIHGVKHVAMTDGTYLSEVVLSRWHRLVRRHVYSHSDAFIGASDGSFELYHAYKVHPVRMYKSHLCANNALFATVHGLKKQFDFIFCARFVQIKNPMFALEVASSVAKRLGRRVSIVFVGSGELDSEIRAAAQVVQGEVDSFFPGFASQKDLPRWYGEASVFLFPTLWEPWGVVANEACAAGIPVLVSPTAGSAHELIRHGENGYVLPLNVDKWVAAAAGLLTDPVLYARMSARSMELVQGYSYDNAARGITVASRAAVGNEATVQRYGGDDYVPRPRVVIIQRRLTHYRVPLFELMSEVLAKRGIDLTVAFGDPTTAEQVRADSGSMPVGVHLDTRYFLNGRLCWQNAWGLVQGADLVVVTQENKLLFNHLLMLGKQRFQLAFWGHGRNFQAKRSNSMSESVKRWISKRADWWFAYTEASADVVRELGFDANKITVLNNAIDTRALQEDLQSLSLDEIETAKRAFGIGPGPVGIVLCSLHADKRLAFLVETAEVIHARVPGFQLLVIGDGPDHGMVEQAAARSGGWLHCLGFRKGREKALFLAMSKVMLNPGMVGLGLLDSLVAGVPMVTTDCGIHSPEIAYLKSGVNGLMTANTLPAFIGGVLRLLDDEALHTRMQLQCKKSAEDTTLENMVQRFCEGIVNCLSAGISRPARVTE